MKAIKRVVLDVHGEEVELLTAIPDSDSELKHIMDMITREYQRRGYLPRELSSFHDEYDERSVYFGTYCNGTLLAAARISESVTMPTKSHYFEFPMPDPLETCPQESLREVGRLTSIRRPGDNPLPRHIQSMMTISALIDYGFKRGFCGGVSTIKASFMRLFERLKLPAIHEIVGAKLIYPRDGILSGFFYDEQDPAVPVYYLEDEAKAIFDGLFRSISRTSQTLLEEPLNVLSHEVLL